MLAPETFAIRDHPVRNKKFLKFKKFKARNSCKFQSVRSWFMFRLKGKLSLIFDYTTAAHKSAKQIARFLKKIIVICALHFLLSHESQLASDFYGFYSFLRLKRIKVLHAISDFSLFTS